MHFALFTTKARSRIPSLHRVASHPSFMYATFHENRYQFKNFVETLKLRIEQMDRATERKLDSDFYRFKMQRGTSDKQQGTDGNNESNDDNKNSNDNDNGNGTSNGNGNRNGNDGVNTALNDSTVSMATIDEHNMKMVKGGLDGLQAREEGKGVIDLDDERFLTHVPFFLRRAYPLLSHLSNKLIKK